MGKPVKKGASSSVQSSLSRGKVDMEVTGNIPVIGLGMSGLNKKKSSSSSVSSNARKKTAASKYPKPIQPPVRGRASVTGRSYAAVIAHVDQSTLEASRFKGDANPYAVLANENTTQNTTPDCSLIQTPDNTAQQTESRRSIEEVEEPPKVNRTSVSGTPNKQMAMELWEDDAAIAQKGKEKFNFGPKDEESKDKMEITPKRTRAPWESRDKGNKGADSDETVKQGSSTKPRTVPRKLNRIPKSAPNPTRAYHLRYDWRLSVTPSNDPVGEMHSAIQSMYEQIKECDRTLVVYTWKEKDSTDKKGQQRKPITSSSEIPTTTAEMQKFFDGARPLTKGGDVYIRVYLGHNEEFSELHENVNWWLRDNKYGWYRKQLQVEKATSLGWLLFSVREIDEELLTQDILARTGIKVGIRWRTISRGKKGKTSEDARVFALHLEIDTEYEDEDRPIIQQLYSSSRKEDFPQGIKMRLVPEIFKLCNVHMKVKVERLRSRQAAFVEYKGSHTTWEIDNLDYKDAELEKRSLRDRLMDLYSFEYPEMKLFHSVDPVWDGNGTVFTFLPKLEDEARARITGLLPFLYLTISPELKHRLDLFFTPGAVARAQTAYWCPIQKQVVTEEDQMIADLVDGEDDQDYYFDLSEIAQASETLTDKPDIVSKGKGKKETKLEVSGLNDNDSVSTFRPGATKTKEKSNATIVKKTTATTATKTKTNVIHPGSTTISTSGGTAMSSQTHESRISVMEENMDELKQSLAMLTSLIRDNLLPTKSGQTTVKMGASADQSSTVGGGLE